MYFTQVLPGVLAAGQDRMCVPVSPVQCVPEQRQSKGMWKGAFNHCLPNRAQGRKWMLKHNSCNSFAWTQLLWKEVWVRLIRTSYLFIYLWEINILPPLWGMIWRNNTGILFSGSLLMLRSPRDANWNSHLDMWTLLIISWTVHTCRALCHFMKPGERQLILCKCDCYLLIHHVHQFQPQLISDSDKLLN